MGSVVRGNQVMTESQPKNGAWWSFSARAQVLDGHMAHIARDGHGPVLQAATFCLSYSSHQPHPSITHRYYSQCENGLVDKIKMRIDQNIQAPVYVVPINSLGWTDFSVKVFLLNF